MTPTLTAADWTAFLADHPDAHLLQTTAWGDLKASFGWEVVRLAVEGTGAQVLFRRLPLGLRLAYLPKGPVGQPSPALLQALDAVCRAHDAFLLKVEPDELDTPEATVRWRAAGFLPSPHAIQPVRTLLVSLEGQEEDLLARMHAKTRYNIRLAGRKGVTVRPWEDVEAFTAMVAETARRNRFGAHTPAYYRRAYDLFHPQGACELLVAEHRGEPLAALMVFAHGRRAWYFYGASTEQERQRMPTYLLQWEAMRWARARGCRTYDLWGVPDADRETLEAQFTRRREGLWGVYRFKRGFGGDLVRWTGAWDRPYHPAVYRLYRLYLHLRARRWTSA